MVVWRRRMESVEPQRHKDHKGNPVVQSALMKKLLLVILLAQPLIAQHRPVNTFSIVARDPQTGQIGVAGQSHSFAVGQILPWAEAGVGAGAAPRFFGPSRWPPWLPLPRTRQIAPHAPSRPLRARTTLHE